MSQANWTEMTGNLSTAVVLRAPSNGYGAPTGGGTGAYGMHSIDVGPGIVSFYNNQAGFNPTPANKGLNISKAMRRGVGGGAGGCAPFIYVLSNGPGDAVGSNAYILGLGDAEPSHIVLRKGVMTGGLPDVAPGSQGVIARSTATFAVDTWVHLFLEAVVNPGSDTVINCKQNFGSVAAPVWVAIPGIPLGIEDDQAAILTGSPPYTTGRGGWAGHFSASNRVLYFDYGALVSQP